MFPQTETVEEPIEEEEVKEKEETDDEAAVEEEEEEEKKPKTKKVSGFLHVWDLGVFGGESRIDFRVLNNLVYSSMLRGVEPFIFQMCMICF